jgi:predicted GTPase
MEQVNSRLRRQRYYSRRQCSEGLVPLDRVSERLRRSGVDFVAVNKVDNPRAEPEVTEFAALGLKAFPVTAIHGEGSALMKAATSLPTTEKQQTQTPPEEKPPASDACPQAH